MKKISEADCSLLARYFCGEVSEHEFLRLAGPSQASLMALAHDEGLRAAFLKPMTAPWDENHAFERLTLKLKNDNLI